MRRDPRDLLGQFRALAPPRQPITMQRWSARRVALAAAAIAITLFAVIVTGQVFALLFLPSSRDLGVSAPSCGTGPTMILSAQAVPSAAMLPCITALPPGWHAGGADIASGHAQFWLNSDLAGPAAITVTLTAACDTSGARQIPSGQPGMRRYEHLVSLAPQFTAFRYYTFPGGCITYQLIFIAPGVSRALANAATSALSFQPRSALVGYVRRTEGLALCGRGAACPP